MCGVRPEFKPWPPFPEDLPTRGLTSASEASLLRGLQVRALEAPELMHASASRKKRNFGVQRNLGKPAPPHSLVK